MTWGRREKKGEKGRKRRLGGSLLSRREMMGVHGRWSAEEIKDGVVRCGRIEVRLVGFRTWNFAPLTGPEVESVLVVLRPPPEARGSGPQ